MTVLDELVIQKRPDPLLARGMKTGGPIYGKKHERKFHGRIGRRSARVWLRANWWREVTNGQG